MYQGILFLCGVAVGQAIGMICGMLLIVICANPKKNNYGADRRDWDKGR